jgi:hypothetical protein
MVKDIGGLDIQNIFSNLLGHNPTKDSSTTTEQDQEQATEAKIIDEKSQQK